MQCFYFQLESVRSPPTVGTSHKHPARVLQSHVSNVVAAVVCPAVLHALVSPYMCLTLFLVNQNCSGIKHTILCLLPASYWLHPLNTSGQISSLPSPTSPTLRASGHRQLAPIQRSRWMLREGRSWTRRSWTGTGWTGCTRFHAPSSYSASSTSTPPSAALSWWWWPCLCFTCEWTCLWCIAHHSIHLASSLKNAPIRLTWTWSWHCFCVQASGRLVPLQPGEWAPASRRPSQSRWYGGGATKPRRARNGSCCAFVDELILSLAVRGKSTVSRLSLCPAGRSNGRRLRRWRGKWWGRTRRPKQRPAHRLPVLHVVLHHNLLHVPHPGGAAERCELNLELNRTSPQEDEAASCSGRLFVLQCSVRVSRWSTSLHI